MQDPQLQANDVTSNHMYALHVLASMTYRNLSQLVAAHEAKKVPPGNSGEYLKQLKSSLQIFQQLDMQAMHSGLAEKARDIVVKLGGDKNDFSPTKSSDLSFGKTHVDDWLDEVYGNDAENIRYAKLVLGMHRWPAVMKLYHHKSIKQHRLFVTYEGERWRCTGASRMGDVWLTKDFAQEDGYQKRVFVDDCTNWGSTP